MLGSRLDQGIQHLKETLSGVAVLAYFFLNAPTYVVTYASPVGLSAILLQDQQQGECKPMAYISQSLPPTERRYLRIEREVLGCVRAVKHLHNSLFGVQFMLLTDNKPLSSISDPHASKIIV